MISKLIITEEKLYFLKVNIATRQVWSKFQLLFNEILSKFMKMCELNLLVLNLQTSAIIVGPPVLVHWCWSDFSEWSAGVSPMSCRPVRLFPAFHLIQKPQKSSCICTYVSWTFGNNVTISVTTLPLFVGIRPEHT